MRRTCLLTLCAGILMLVACPLVAGESDNTAAPQHPSGLPRGGPCDPCDVNCDALRDMSDVPAFVDALVSETSTCGPCAADLNGDALIDGRDIEPFVACLLTPAITGACCTAANVCVVTTPDDCDGLWRGPDSPCSAGACAFAGLTAYRPQHRTGYFPYNKTAVPDADEASATSGPGIRINAPGDQDPQGEDDLIEILVSTAEPDTPLALSRAHEALRVWTTRTKAAGTEVAFTGDRTAALPFAPSATTLTLWVEWAAAVHGEGALHLEPLDAAYALDTLQFHTFHGIVVALGGENQVPSLPLDPNNGTFVVATSLYQRGYDVHMYDEDSVGPDGSGAVLVEVTTAIAQRGVEEVAIFGYSHGGGSTHDLADRLDNDRAGIGLFEIVVTSYADAVRNSSDIDVNQELRRPPSTGYHANHYQVGSLFDDFFLDGGPVTNSNPPPTGLNVETTPWGAGSTHFTVDDYVQVRDYIETNLAGRLAR